MKENIVSKNVLFIISSYNYKEKYKEWKSSVYHVFVTEIAISKKSMIPMTLKYQNVVDPLNRSKSTNFLKNLRQFILKIF